nr:hypothetical protein [Nitrospirota bacterium]
MSGVIRGVQVLALGAMVGVMLLVQRELDLRRSSATVRMDRIRFLPQGKYLRPITLGYNHIAADILWLRFVQVLGERKVTAQEYEWIYHALDVITTLDPQYVAAYQIGGIVLTELAQRIDLSNRLLEKGLQPNPTAWQIPFALGYNHFFFLQDHERAAEYMARAARLPGRPPYVPRLAARLYAQAGNPEVALEFLDAVWRQTQDQTVRDALELRMKEVAIERDIRILEQAVARYGQRHGRVPQTLAELVKQGILPAIPQEPFGGVYRLDTDNGTVSSSTHPERLRVYRFR